MTILYVVSCIISALAIFVQMGLFRNVTNNNSKWKRGKNEFDAERYQPLLPSKAHLKEVTNFLETDNIKTQVLGKIAKNYYFSGKG